jgi:zinc protease
MKHVSKGLCRTLKIVSALMFIMGALLTTTKAINAKDEAKVSSGPEVTYFKMENGLDVVVIPDHRAPVVTHMVWYRVGAADEAPGVSGIAHFLEHLMFKGTEKIAPGEFSKIIARNGGEDNAFTSQDVTAYFQRVAKEHLPMVMEMEADRMSNLKLLEKDVLTERDVILEERRSRVENNPNSLLGEQISASLYLSHPYGIPVIGWMHEMAKLSRKDALEHYENYYAPNNAILIVAGDVTSEEVKRLADKFYAPVKRGPDLPARERPMEPPHVSPRRVVLEDERAGKLAWQRHYLAPSYKTAPKGDSEALEMLMKVATGGTTSRLYKKLVVADKLASSAGGGYSASGLDYGGLYIYAIPSKGVTIEQIESAIDEVFEKIAKDGISELELNRARNAYIADYVYGNDSQSGLARRYGFALATGWSIQDIESYPERLKKVTVEDLQRVAAKYLDINSSVTGVLIPKPKKMADKK